jgi:hypothetical protein
MEWSVLVETRAPSGTNDDELLELLGDLREALADRGAAAGGDGRGWDVRLTLEAPGPAAAVGAGIELVTEWAQKVGLPVWPVVRTEAVEASVLEAELAVRNFPDIVGVQEVLAILGVTKQRLWQLRGAGQFPDPMVELAATPVWLRPAVEAFVETWNRKPGRPSAVQELLAANDELERSIGGRLVP